MLEFVRGDFFEFDADIRINTVNCVGVMGAGVALAFKKKYPEMFKDYVKKCKEGVIKPGHPSTWKSEDMFSKSVEVINFPTKDDWRNPSEYSYIELGLKWLSEYLTHKNDITVTLPALGCGHGGLDWEVVRSLIKKHLGDSSNRILVFEPLSSKNAGNFNSLPEYKYRELLNNNIEIIGANSEQYPDRLRHYTEKDIYIFNNSDRSGEFKLAIISSSKPDEIEREVIKQLIEYASEKKYSILFGGSAADKKLALEAMDKGVKTGVFLPTGILFSAKKIKESKSRSMPTLLSVGDPYELFDRKSYMPSVLSRIYLSEVVVFTTGKLEWIAKHKKSLQKSGAKFFHITYEDISESDIAAIDTIKSKSIDVSNPKKIFSTINI